MTLRKGTRLPDARLATVGGTSFAFHELRGRRAVVYGWGSWSPSAKKVAALQRWHEKTGVPLVTVAFEVIGPAAAMSVLKPAGANHVMLVDATCTLTRRWGIRGVPFTLVIDEEGVLLHAGESPDLRTIESALKSKAPKPGPELAFDTATVKRQYQVEVLMQACTNLLGRKRRDDAKDALRKAQELDPENRLIGAQLEAL